MARMIDVKPTYFQFEGLVTGHHIYRQLWTPHVGEKLECYREPDNTFDFYAIKVMKDGVIVGHVFRDISRYCTYAILSGGRIQATVTGRPQNKQGNGIEVPVTFHIKGPVASLAKTRLCIEDYFKRTLPDN